MLEINRDEEHRMKLIQTCEQYFLFEARRIMSPFEKLKIPIVNMNTMKINETIMRRLFFKIHMGKMFKNVVWNEKISGNILSLRIVYDNVEKIIPFCQFDDDGYFKKYIYKGGLK